MSISGCSLSISVLINASSSREAIEDSRVRAEEESDDKERKAQQFRGIHNLRRYFLLIEFQAYLQATRPGMLQDHETFEAFLRHNPGSFDCTVNLSQDVLTAFAVFETFEHEMLAQGPDALKPLERVSVTDGVAFPDEAKQLVANRTGIVLSAATILKSDFFSGLQKMSLPECVMCACTKLRRLTVAQAHRRSSELQEAEVDAG